jgi:hypothetical protein
MPFKYPSLQDRILANTVQLPGPLESPCWIWIAKRARNGYGRLSIRNTDGIVCTHYAHRIACKEFKGVRLIGNTPVRHLCDVRACCNPDHLVPNSSYKTNSREMIAKGRHRNQYSKYGSSM